MFFEHSKLIESSPKLNLVQPYITLVPWTILVFFHPSCTSVLSQFSSLTIIYFILGVLSVSLTFLVPMSANYRPPSHQSIFCILHFSPFLTKFILLAMCLVCLVSLPFLACTAGMDLAHFRLLIHELLNEYPDMVITWLR